MSAGNDGSDVPHWGRGPSNRVYDVSDEVGTLNLPVVVRVEVTQPTIVLTGTEEVGALRAVPDQQVPDTVHMALELTLSRVRLDQIIAKGIRLISDLAEEEAVGSARD
jgi:hypothetical protein